MEEIKFIDDEKFEQKLKGFSLTDREIETIFGFLDLYEWAIIDNGELYNIYDKQCGTIREEEDLNFDLIMKELYLRMQDYYLYEHETDFESDDLEYNEFYLALFEDLLSIGNKLGLADEVDSKELKENIDDLKLAIIRATKKNK